MSEKKWVVPSVIDPAAKVCVQLEIPNEAMHIAAFWGALEQLTKAYNWQDSYIDGSAVAYVWRDVVSLAAQAVRDGQNCVGEFTETDDCINYPPYAPFIGYNLYNPYEDPTFVPPGYLLNPYIPGGYPLYEPDDLIVDFFSFPFFGNWWDLISGNLPRIEIHTVGDGQIELDLLNVLQGGMAVIKQGSPPNILDIIIGTYEEGIRIVDLGLDIAIPIELDVVHAEEINVVVGSGVPQITYVTFIPVVDDAFPPFGLPLRFGGGLRRVGLCGFEDMAGDMGITNLRLTDCGIEVFQDGEWTLKADIEDCLIVSEVVVDLQDQDTVIFSTLQDLDDNMVENSNDIQEINNFPPDGNTYDPPAPIGGSDELCQLTGHMASKIGDFIAQIDTYATESTLMDALEAALAGDGYYAVTELIAALNNFFVGGADPLFSDYQTVQDAVHEWLYCENNLSKDDLATYVEAELARGDEIADMLNSLSLSTWQQWQVLGEFATGYDCSSFVCGAWCYRFDVSTGFGPFTTVYGNPTGRGIENAHWAVGNNTFSGWQLTLNPNNVAGLTHVRVQAHYIDVGIENTTILYMIIPTGTGTGGYTDIKPGGWHGVPVSVDVTQDCTDWSDILIYGTTAAKANGMYAFAGEGYVEYIELSGTGPNPFGSDNCP